MSRELRRAGRRAAAALPTLAALAGAVICSAALASEVRETRLGSARQWERGRLQALALASDGGLSLAPALRPLSLGSAAPPPYFLCQTRDRDGNLYAGAGGPARVYRFSPLGSATLLFQGEELQVTALALDSKGRLYVATSPRGRVYRIRPDGEAEPFFETEERYLWSLAVDGSDQVWVGSGERGRLFRVDSGGRGSVALDSPDPHVTALVADADGSMVAGTDGRGLVYRIGKDGAARTLLEGGLRQVSTLAIAANRAIYVGLVGPASATPPEARRRDGSGSAVEEHLPGPAQPFERESPLQLGEQAPPVALTEALEPPPRSVPRSRIYLIETSGAPREIWSAEGEWLHTLAPGPDGTLYFGTGEPARLYRLEAPDRTALIARPDASHLVSVAATDKNRVTLLTGRPGLAFVAGEGLAENGNLESEPVDAGTIARWGRVRWQADLPPAARLELFSRSGNSARPDSGWSGWSAAYTDAAGSAIVSPPGRYLQWKIAMSRGKEARSPALRDLSFSYLSANRPPRLEQVTLHPPGDYFLPDGGMERSGGAPPAPGRPRRRAGLRSVSWLTSDPDGDRLVATLRMRRAGGAEWSTLAEGIRSSYYTWSVAGLPEGWHEIQVEISDQGPNPPETASRVSGVPQPFKVDTTPPVIEITRNQLAASPPVLEFRIRDALSSLRGVELRVDSGAARRLSPVDGIEDSPSEEFRWQGSQPPRRIHIETGDTEGNRTDWTWRQERPAGG